MEVKRGFQEPLLPYQPSSVPKRPEKFRRSIARAGLALAGVVALCYIYQGFPHHFITPRYTSTAPVTVTHTAYASTQGSWNWAGVEPSRDLQWHSCYDDAFTCARLDVPLDWLDPSEEKRVVLAVIRLEAKNKLDYKGPVFINPGGPGGSGVSFARSSGEQLQAIVGDNHDIISFDPRGIGASVPRIECWGSSQRRHDWDTMEIGVMDAYHGLVYEAFVQNKAYSKQCETYMEKTTPELLRHLGTASHARDMLEISEKAGFMKLKYWGFSYGTILGGTFAAMFPERVERLVSDGNVDYHDWYSLEQMNFLEDTDKIMDAFFEFCFKAGPEKCEFYTNTNADAVRKRYLDLLSTLRTRPVLIPAYANGTGPLMPELVTYSQFQLLVRTAIYKPIHKFPDLAKVMVALEKNDGLPFYNMNNDASDPPTLDFCALNDTVPTIPIDFSDSFDAFPAIMCADGEQFLDTPESFAEYAEALRGVSKYAGTSNAHFRLSCAGRTIRPKYRYAATEQGANTSFPILFIGNIADNVTPLLSARNNSARFPGSVVLVQKSYGHCTLAAPSTCSALVINAYFQNGTLPEPDTYCDQDYELFENAPTIQVEDVNSQLALAVHKLSQTTNLVRGFM
ncbi:hypothetical protein BP6252_03979 [Coleophoma cylindrospora]|uniref:AB hydrolase-1 domain-containing protein n=1 Tax=Coleophoma cylindrospora TaxID=1849047 RepID=A0A3D8S935_9HELO|nr:hypothetical protein BP6252_03979 [Coleophoma cylindrospora]